jgi:hypothetical protein
LRHNHKNQRRQGKVQNENVKPSQTLFAFVPNAARQDTQKDESKKRQCDIEDFQH